MIDKTLVLGIGNLVLQDEGVGIHVVQALEKEELAPHVDILDGGTGGVGIIGELEQYKKVIMVDATLDGTLPGTIKMIKPKFSSDYPQLLSSHEFGLRDMIESMIVRETIPEIDLITISVNNIQDIGMDLSPEVEDAIPQVVELIKSMTK